jgi:hypothetical protein
MFTVGGRRMVRERFVGALDRSWAAAVEIDQGVVAVYVGLARRAGTQVAPDAKSRAWLALAVSTCVTTLAL